MGYDVGICKVKWTRPASSYIDGKQVQTKEYSVWRAMMQRQKQGYKNMGYEGVTVVGDFTNYDLFYDWLIQQVGYGEKDDKQQWFDKIKELAGEMGYAKEVKEFKENPDKYKAHVGDVSTVLRVALTGRTNTPDMYEIMQVLGKESIIKKNKKAKEQL